MTRQPTLFDESGFHGDEPTYAGPRDDVGRAKARRLDPATSHVAARDVEARGHAQRQRQLCLDDVLRLPGQTAAEIALAIGLERHAPSRRLPELRDQGLVCNGPARICGVTGHPSLTWLPVEVDAARRASGEERSA